MLKEETDNYIRHLISNRHISEHTGAAYRSDLEKLRLYAGDLGPECMDAPFLQTYIDHLEEDGASAASLHRTASCLRGFFRFLLEKAIVSSNPAEDLVIHIQKQEQAAPAALTDEEWERLLNAAGKCGTSGLREIAVLELIRAAGIKAGELVRLRIRDFDFLLNEVSVTAEDGSLRVMRIGNRAGNAVRNYIDNNRSAYRSENDSVFTNYEGKPLSRQGLWKTLRALGQKAQINGEINPDRIRKSYLDSFKINRDGL